MNKQTTKKIEEILYEEVGDYSIDLHSVAEGISRLIQKEKEDAVRGFWVFVKNRHGYNNIDENLAEQYLNSIKEDK